MARMETLDLFGGSRPWSPLDWRSVDDRVRGGMSQSYMDCKPFSPVARFYGNLDIDTLGGAGFASQRTTGDDRLWDLSGYDGVVLEIERADAKTYTFNLKDEIRPRDPNNGREQSSVSWEFDFKIEQEDLATQSQTEYIYIQWDMFVPTYRGKEKKDAAPLKLNQLKRMSFMMRSFFGEQKGDFSLSIRSISAYKMSKKGHMRTRSIENAFPYPYRDEPSAIEQPKDFETGMDEKLAGSASDEQQQPQGLLGWICSACTDCVRLR